MMPKRVAETDPNTQITDTIGSGPFIFKKDEWKPGEKAVYLKNTKYKPRAEPPSGFAGGKVPKVDRVEWIWIADPQTSINALLNGEIDFIEAPPHDLLPLLEKDANIQFLVIAPMGRQYAFRFNVLHKPFDNPKVRQAVAYAFNQKDFLNSTIGDAKYYVTCKSLYPVRLAAGDDQGLGGQDRQQRRQGQGAAAAGRLRRHARRAHAVDRHHLAIKPCSGRQVADGEGWPQGRPAGHGLADAGVAPLQEGSARSRRLERVPHLLGLGGCAGPGRRPASSTPAATRRPSAGRATPSSSGCAMPSPRRPTRPSRRRSPRPVAMRAAEYPTHVLLGQYTQPSAFRKNIIGRAGRHQRRVLEHREEMTWSIVAHDPAHGCLRRGGRDPRLRGRRELSVRAIRASAPSRPSRSPTATWAPPSWICWSAGMAPDAALEARAGAPTTGRHLRQVHVVDARAARRPGPAGIAWSGAASARASTFPSPATCWRARGASAPRSTASRRSCRSGAARAPDGCARGWRGRWRRPARQAVGRHAC